MCLRVLSWVWLCATPWTGAHQAPLFMEFSSQGWLSMLPFLFPEDLPNPGIEPMSLVSPALTCGFFIQVCYIELIKVLWLAISSASSITLSCHGFPLPPFFLLRWCAVVGLRRNSGLPSSHKEAALVALNGKTISGIQSFFIQHRFCTSFLHDKSELAGLSPIYSV